MDLSISSNIKAVSRGLDKAAKKQIPFAVAQTLTALAFEAMQEERKQASKHIHMPKPFTVKSFLYKPKKVNKKKLEAWVYVNKADTERKYMKFLIHGGISRGKGGRALLHPTTHTKLNKHGNMPGDKLHRKTVVKSLAKKAKFFSGIPKGMAGQENNGIWQRYGKKKHPRIRMVAQWKPSRKYVAKFPFYEIAGQVVVGRANKIFNKQFERAMLSAK